MYQFENYFGKSFKASSVRESLNHEKESMGAGLQPPERVRLNDTAVSRSGEETTSSAALTISQAEESVSEDKEAAVSRAEVAPCQSARITVSQRAEEDAPAWQLKVIDAQLLQLARHVEMHAPQGLWRPGNFGDMDCCFLAALGAEAALNPDNIIESLELNADQTMSISFLRTAGRPNFRITLAVPSLADFGRFEAKSTFGLWPCVFHRAYEVWREQYLNVGHTVTPRDSLVSSLELLTGKSYCYAALRMYSEEELQTCIARSFAARLPLMVAILQVDEESGELVPWHAYGLIDFDENNSLLTLRDPWLFRNGRISCRPDDDKRTDIGIFKVKLSVFRKQFDCISLPTAFV